MTSDGADVMLRGIQLIGRSIMAEPEWYVEEGLRFTCTQCGNCCTGPPGYVWFDEHEVRAMADYLKVSEAEFRREYAHEVYGRWSLNERRSGHGYDCVFLKREEGGKALCSIYPVRPQQCRTWPFWKENLKSERVWEAVKQVCPGMGKGKIYPVEKIRIIRDSTPDL